MSTYLVAFLVGDFKCTEGEADGVKIRVLRHAGQDGSDALRVDVAKYHAALLR